MAKIKLKYAIPGYLSGQTAQIGQSTVTFDETTLFTDATVFNQPLAQLSAGLAASAYPVVQNSMAHGFACENLRALGFEDIEDFNYSDTAWNATLQTYPTGHDEKNQVAYTLGYQPVWDVVAIVIRGTPQGIEWVGDFQYGGDDGATNLPYHGNYALAGEALLTNLQLYRETHQTSRLWVTGQSRGGAVAEYVAKVLTDEHSATVYSYAVAPAPAFRGEPLTGYANIHNLINPRDFVPNFNVPGWQFYHIGQVHAVHTDQPAFLEKFAEEVDNPFVTNPTAEAAIASMVAIGSGIAPTLVDYYQKQITWHDGAPMTPYEFYFEIAQAFYMDAKDLSPRVFDFAAYTPAEKDWQTLLLYFIGQGEPAVAFNEHASVTYFIATLAQTVA